jgi:ADP-ribose pyrophosphatase
MCLVCTGLILEENMPLITSRSVELTTPWFDLVAKRIHVDEPPYYSLRMSDYVSVIALTAEQQVVLVRQYRPAVECHTLELPSGHVDADETPEQSARRELTEETGYYADSMELLGALLTDTGRHENRLWCFLAPMVIPLDSGYDPEPGIETVLVHRHALLDMICAGEYNHALNLAVLMMAIARHGQELLLDLKSGRKG